MGGGSHVVTAEELPVVCSGQVVLALGLLDPGQFVVRKPGKHLIARWFGGHWNVGLVPDQQFHGTAGVALLEQ